MPVQPLAPPALDGGAGRPHHSVEFTEAWVNSILAGTRSEIRLLRNELAAKDARIGALDMDVAQLKSHANRSDSAAMEKELQLSEQTAILSTHQVAVETLQESVRALHRTPLSPPADQGEVMMDPRVAFQRGPELAARGAMDARTSAINEDVAQLKRQNQRMSSTVLDQELLLNKQALLLKAQQAAIEELQQDVARGLSGGKAATYSQLEATPEATGPATSGKESWTPTAPTNDHYASLALQGITIDSTHGRREITVYDPVTQSIELEESMWDATMLIGTQSIGYWCSVSLIFLLALNVIVVGLDRPILRRSCRLPPPPLPFSQASCYHLAQPFTEANTGPLRVICPGRPAPRFTELTSLACRLCAQQSSFIYLLDTTDLTEPEYASDDVADYRSWRRSQAHAFAAYDPITQTSLSYRVCSGDAALQVSANVQSDYQDVAAYLDENGLKGRLMLGLALLAWYCSKPGRARTLGGCSRTSGPAHLTAEFYCGQRWRTRYGARSAPSESYFLCHAAIARSSSLAAR